jgi:O-antigen/teichoic acid export membrane protein
MELSAFGTSSIGRWRRFVALCTKVQRSALFYGAFATAIRVGANVLLVPFLLKRFSATELAIWWVFVALGAVANLADFGFGQAISRVYSYLWAGAEDFDAEGLRPAHSDHCPNYLKLRQFSRTVQFFYMRIALAATVLLAIGGTPFIVRMSRSLDSPIWLLVCWAVFVLATGYSLGSSHWMLACNGVNRVRELQASFFWSGLSFVMTAAFMLLVGAGLETMVVATLVRAIIARQICCRAYRSAVPDGELPEPKADFDMLKRLWPNARKFGILSLGAYLVSNGTTLICSQLLGADATAAFGLTAQIGNFLVAFSTLWLAVKWPQITMMRMQGKLEEMSIIFARRLFFSLITFICLSAMLVIAGNKLLQWKGTHTRLLEMPLLGIYLFYLGQQLFYVQFGTLTFTENVVPFFRISLLTGIGLLGLTVLLARAYGLWGVVIAPIIATFACSTWYVTARGFRGQPLSVKQLTRAAFLGHP